MENYAIRSNSTYRLQIFSSPRKKDAGAVYTSLPNNEDGKIRLDDTRPSASRRLLSVGLHILVGLLAAYGLSTLR